MFDTIKFKSFCSNKFLACLEKISNRLEDAGEPFAKFMLKVSAVKFALTIVALLITVSLFTYRLHIFDSISVQFSEWTSSSLIAFTLSMIIVKLVVVSVCLASFVLHRNTIDGIILFFKELKQFKIPVVLRKRVRVN